MLNTTTPLHMFAKYQGLGNDFVIVDQRNNHYAATADLSQVTEICHRRRGIGADGLMVLLDGTNNCDYTMRIINADGTEAEMCGNGIRCFALFIQEQEEDQLPVDSISTATEALTGRRVCYTISTLAGKIVTEILPSGEVSVDMGLPSLYPFSSTRRLVSSPSHSADTTTVAALNSPPAPLSVQLVHDEYLVTDVSMGNPHAVVFVPSLDHFLPEHFRHEGPCLSTRLDIFPHGANAGFAQVLSPSHLRLEVWERGSGHTQACGTGACAAVVAGVERGLVRREDWCEVKLPGGILTIKWGEEDGHVVMRGAAEKVFEGHSEGLARLFRPPS